MDTQPSSTQSIKKPVTPDLTTVETTQDITLKPLTADRHESLLQMQRMDPFCKCISKWLSNCKAPQHEADLFPHIKGLLYKHVMDTNQKFMALIIPKVWKFIWPMAKVEDIFPPEWCEVLLNLGSLSRISLHSIVLVEVHDKFGTPRSNLHILSH